MDTDDRSYLIRMGGSRVASVAPELFYDIRCYFEAMEAFLDTSSSERQLRLRGIRDKLDAAVGKTLLDTGNNLLWEDYFPSELRASVFISIMSLFERCLNGICVDVAVLLRTQVLHNELKGSAIQRSRTFLMKVCSLHAPGEEMWERMINLQKLRNSLVHNGGMPETLQKLKSTQNLIDSMEGVTCGELGMDLEPEFILYVFGEVTGFFEQLSGSIGEACETVRRFEHS